MAQFFFTECGDVYLLATVEQVWIEQKVGSLDP